ncbi:DUF4435 domain-containing protein [Paenibacillus sp. KS-LC4]|uniref:DUF4435 domain-containing protein n=1 Tax=Paenibacillus sp. KS-LC4 TaxID=2979727 RepID=UPI0030CFD074
MNGKVEKERSKRNSFSVHWAKFIKLYNKYKEYPICFVEGEDIKYYGSRIENLVGVANFVDSGGKKGVIKFRRKLEESDDFSKLTSLFFVDKDFDLPLKDEAIYETPCYSVENLYTTSSAFERTLLTEFGLVRTDDAYQKCMNLLYARQREFHTESTLLNVFIACQREIERESDSKLAKLNLSDIKLTDFFEINLSEVKAKYDLDTLYSYFKKSHPIPEELLIQKQKEYINIDYQKFFRGKFEIEFYRIFLDKLIHIAKQGNNEYFKDRINVKLFITKINILSDLSGFADTPPCLKNYVLARCNAVIA